MQKPVITSIAGDKQVIWLNTVSKENRLSVVYPSNEAVLFHPPLACLSKQGLPAQIEWSGTPNGPHWCFDFTEVASTSPSVHKILGVGNHIQIGLFSKQLVVKSEWRILASLDCEEIKMFLNLSSEPQPLFLASSLSALGTMARVFEIHMEKLRSQQGPDKWRSSWEDFSKHHQQIDKLGHFHEHSYWASMAHEYLSGF